MASQPPADPLTAGIDPLSPPVIEEVPFSLFALHDRKSTNLINSSPNKLNLKSQNRFFDFYFQELLFVNIVTIATIDFVDNSRFDFYWVDQNGDKKEGSTYTKDNFIALEINGIAQSVGFKPPRAYFTKPYIQSVSVYGFQLSQVGDFIKFSDTLEAEKTKAISKIAKEASDLEAKKIEVSGLQAQRGTLQQDITALKNTVSRENGKLKRIEVQRNELISQTGELERSLLVSNTSLEIARTQTSKLVKTRSNLSNSVQQKSAKLTELEANIHLFPSELAGFSKQGGKDAKTFFWLSLVPVTLIVVMFFLLTMGAVDLTTKITGSEQINLAALVVSRAPYVAVAGSIITVSYYIARMLILEIIRISRQRLALTKISIIAKDISSSIDSDLELPTEEKYYKRLVLKMDMMKDHLKEYISSDFQPSIPDDVSLPSNILKILGRSKEPNTET